MNGRASRMMTRAEKRKVRTVDWYFQTCNSKGMRNGKSKGMNGGRHLPEAHAGLSDVCCSSPPSHPLITEGERERYGDPAEGRHGANRNVTAQGPPTLSSLPVTVTPLGEKP